MTKIKKVKFNKTEANVMSNKIIRNAKNINHSEANTSSLIMIDIITLASYCSINQSETQIRKTLKALELETQADIIKYKKLYSVDALGNLIENPKAKASKDSEAKDSKDSKDSEVKDSDVSDNVYLDKVFNDIKDKVVDTEALGIHIHKLVSLTRELKKLGEADTKELLQA